MVPNSNELPPLTVPLMVIASVSVVSMLAVASEIAPKAAADGFASAVMWNLEAEAMTCVLLPAIVVPFPTSTTDEEIVFAELVA